MADSRQISIKDLTAISGELVATFFPTQDIYSLLVLSITTISRFSQKRRHLNTQTKIELAITYLPDLIDFLVTEGHISEQMGTNLNSECAKRRSELPLILQSYIYASGGLRFKMNSPSSKTKTSCVIS